MKLTKKYHIYINGYCHYPNLDEEIFHKTWNRLIDNNPHFLHEQISYEEVIDNKEEYSLEGKIY
ncbi:hypothetical protein b23_0248 [Synechococcus phage B23]|nr:hypothetical protein b23_0248 [Synechococcus phage B23]